MMRGRPKPPITPQTYIRQLPYSVCKGIATSLDLPGTATNWKDFAQKIPRSRGDPQSKYTAEKMRLFEAIASKGDSPTLAIIDDWSTANATVQDLVDVLHSLDLLSLIQLLEKVVQRPPDYQSIVNPQMSSIPQIHTPTASYYSAYPTLAPSIPPNGYSRPQSIPPHGSVSPYPPASYNPTSYNPAGPYSIPVVPPPFSLPPSVPERRPVLQRQPTEHESIANPTLSIQDLHLLEAVEAVTTYSYTELRSLTSNFSDSLKLGEGAFGSVFKGLLSSVTKEKGGEPVSRQVAIKRLKLDTPEFATAIIEQFKKEIDVISALQNENILPLVGYSCDGPELCLVYDYMYNGSLSSSLDACRNQSMQLTVAQRLEIGRGSAAGIAYMHDKEVIHRDIKSSNILLDSEMKPRISDFGLIRSTTAGQANRTSTNTAHPIGTWVYMSPEACKGNVSYAMDVFSFGVVILELLTGDEVVDESRDPSHLTMYVEESLESGEREIESFFDRNAGAWKSTVGSDLHDLSSRCLEHKRAKRPKMTEVVRTMGDLCKMQNSSQ